MGRAGTPAAVPAVMGTQPSDRTSSRPLHQC
jgi:hypothetical protein